MRRCSGKNNSKNLVGLTYRDTYLGFCTSRKAEFNAVFAQLASSAEFCEVMAMMALRLKALHLYVPEEERRAAADCRKERSVSGRGASNCFRCWQFGISGGG
jgi:hypothetical protein